jgi:two-component system response regulator AlgR
MSTRILIADDSPIVRQCIGRLLGDHVDWEVCGEATDGDDAVCKAKELNPDLVVLDFLMPRRMGSTQPERLASSRPALQFCSAPSV